MNENAVRFWVGVMVVSTGLSAAILVLLLGNQPALFQKKYLLHLEFTNAPGVSRNTPIRRSGILIGRVEDVTLTPSGMVQVTAGINKGKKIPDNSRCEVQTGMLSDAEIEFYIPSGLEPSQEYFSAGQTIRGSRPTGPLSAVTNLEGGLSKAIDAVTTAGDQLGETLGKINALIDHNQQHIDSIVQRTDSTLALIQETTKFTHDLMSNDNFRQDLKGEIQQLPQTLHDAREAIAQLRGTMSNMDHTMSLVDNNLENIRNFTEPLGENGKNIAHNIDESVRRLNQLMIEMETFGKSINNKQGTLGRLTQDDEIYQRLNRTVRNIEEISYRLKPIVNDARIISDKMARHPGTILRDAILPGTGTKGLPPQYCDPANCAKQPASSWQR